MKYIFLFVSVFTCLLLNGEESSIQARKFWFENHSYICFDEKFYIHDPDCGCERHLYGSINNSQNNQQEYRIHLYKPAQSNHD